jgi:hypothetical protein
MLVGADLESRGGDSMVRDRDLDHLTLADLPTEIDEQLVLFMAIRQVAPLHANPVHPHPTPFKSVGLFHEVQAEGGVSGLDVPHSHRGHAPDDVCRIAQNEIERVMFDIDVGILRIGVG